MPFFLQTENSKTPFVIGDTIKIDTPAGIPIRWRIHVEGSDRRLADSYTIESHRDLFESHLFTIHKIDGDNPFIFDLFTKTEGFSVGIHRFPIVQVLKTICVIEVNVVARRPIDVPPPPPVDDPPTPPRHRKETAPKTEEENEPKTKELGPWTKFGIRSLYGAMALILLCAVACGGFTFWTSGKVVNLFTEWASMNLKTAAPTEQQPVATPPEASVADQIPPPLDTRPILQPQ
ncbi:TPA: hypothetical protein DEP34_02605 [Candidatus Uhrbacteria bacterium]|uniref:Uncharacterized protein n=2 Tax=Candidatus Uhriibacteriota TaxID=1752732 RepID=A0A0G1Q5U4_9BACT|nr:MAG: hypothetical protein UX45_C0018G0013 [Candidatus Uhrbacteria bacterium GW2011_GWF2_46_218]KKU40421.1 MAG: hypothetical protein UX57_C0017G0013 [Candidatus Uhrbacteria bacterium GW2011_GWE2_46_68]HBK33884.1 hypothetical protein [Candidatus Uhrbacteria bacterium]HCB19253.1 hypothetical protein [Candidatus Uhrbacteria bacterium]